MSKKKKIDKELNKEEEIKEEVLQEEAVEEKKETEETALEQVEPELEETESYKKATFKEKLSLKFRKKLIASRFRTLILVVFLIVAVWGINLWAENQNLAQIDVTKNHLYSLTQTSKDQLKDLKKDVKIYAYGYTKDNEIINFLNQYNAFNKKITNEIITESNNYELVSKYNLGTYSTLIVTCGDKDKVIYPDYEFSTSDSSTGDTIDLAEETITNAILKVSTDDPVKVYYATGNGESGTEKLSNLTAYLEEEVYEVDDLNLLTVTEIPSDCDILAIVGPTEDMTESQAEIIKKYVNNGGNLLICALQPTSTELTNFQKILDLYGVKINKGLLYEGSNKNYLAYQNTQPLPYVLIPEYSASNSITSNFAKSSSNQMIIMPWSQSLSVNEVTEENVSVTSSDILTTSSSCYNIEDYSKGITSASVANLEKSTYTLGSELTRTMTNGDDKKESKLVIYSNIGFITDTYQDAQIQQLPTMQNAGNINLALNTFAELGEQTNLITVRKAANVTTFQKNESEDRVVKLIIFGIPVLIILIGIIVWNHRRKKR